MRFLDGPRERIDVPPDAGLSDARPSPSSRYRFGQSFETVRRAVQRPRIELRARPD